MNKIAALNSTPISALLSDAVVKEQNTDRVVLKNAFKSVHYLVRQGLPLRGRDHREVNFWRMMIDRTESLPAAHQWMLHWDNWLSDTIQNEMIELLAHAVQRRLVFGEKVSHYFGLTADGTTDISSSKQFSCHVHYVDADLCQQSVFWGFYSAPDSKAGASLTYFCACTCRLKSFKATVLTGQVICLDVSPAYVRVLQKSALAPCLSIVGTTRWI